MDERGKIVQREGPAGSRPGLSSGPDLWGDLRVLETPLARTLLESTIPARLASLARDGTPRITPTWFHWTGSELMARIALTPTRADLVDFQRRLPDALGGIRTESEPS